MHMKFIFRYLLISLWLSAPLAGFSVPPQGEAHQKQIDRERKKKQKEGEKEYKKLLKEHHQRQSKETKAMMRQSRKDSKTNTPVKKK